MQSALPALPKREKHRLGCFAVGVGRSNFSCTLRVGAVCLCFVAPQPGSARQVVDQTKSSAPVLSTIGFALHDPYRLLPRERESVAEELERIAGRLGVTAVLIETEAFALQPAAININVILIRYPGRSPISGKGILGAVCANRQIAGNQDPSHYIRVFLLNALRVMGYRDSAIRRPLHFIRFNLCKPRQRVRIGRALGRIIFHETIHALAPGVEHTASGLMRETFTREDLEQPTIEIQPHLQDAFGRAVAATLTKGRKT